MGAVVVLAVLAVLSSIVLSLDPVPIQFQTAPVLVQTGGQAVITVVTISNVLSISWTSPGGAALGVWVPAGAVVSSGGQFNGRVNITATQLQISSVQLMDAGNFTVTVVPSGATGLGQNSRSVEVRVYDAVNGVNLFVPSVALEGGNISLTCTWTQGTQISVIWGKGGATITPNSRVTVSGGSLMINPGNRSDTGVYSCTVGNPVSAKTATASLTVYYGPDSPTLQLDPQVNCVGGGQAEVGKMVKVTCQSASLPPALFSWQKNGQSVTADPLNGSVITFQSISYSQSGEYVCVASNAITTKTAQQVISLTVVGTCLSPGAVAGIVIGCVLAIILIIIAIILLLHWRKKKHRLRQDTRKSKSNGNLQPRNRNEQTRAVLARQVQQPGRRPPTPPPVIPLAQFQALPQQRLPESRPRQPQVTRRPVTHAHLNGHQLPGHAHPSMQRLPQTQRHLTKQRQAPGGRPRL
ncbi:carcinoembryonic antigen-related cell adhesion molecule 20 isoform X2 [Scleropages formosus]|uniref:carcinoembryonic antigen-related cell adhesion molecule 20 isoform X2 n=1 Tax=Scleropages formosus TaxID=113540 RepID=UPI0008786373|nr:carcinoembryonic antigen-related cell adhesion molecule 20-like isoform X2 [Scleropages formosus]